MALSDRVRQMYPEKAASFDALRDCQMAGFKAGAVGLLAGGLASFAGATAVGRHLYPLAYVYRMSITAGEWHWRGGAEREEGSPVLVLSIVSGRLPWLAKT